MTTNVSDNVIQDQIKQISAPLVLDLVDYFRLIEQEMIDLVNNASDYTEEQLYYEIEKIIGE